MTSSDHECEEVAQCEAAKVQNSVDFNHLNLGVSQFSHLKKLKNCEWVLSRSQGEFGYLFFKPKSRPNAKFT